MSGPIAIGPAQGLACNDWRGSKELPRFPKKQAVVPRRCHSQSSVWTVSTAASRLAAVVSLAVASACGPRDPGALSSLDHDGPVIAAARFGFSGLNDTRPPALSRRPRVHSHDPQRVTRGRYRIDAVGAPATPAG